MNNTEIIHRHNLSNCNSIYQAYIRPSKTKQFIWLKVCSMCRNLEGEKLRIISHNAFRFTCGFIVGNTLYYFSNYPYYKKININTTKEVH